jgi:RNA polymerase sigma-70 factor (ECF subfamily)
LIIEESVLVERLQSKDVLALNYLYDSYGKALFGVLCRIVGSEEQAEEVLQDAFLKIWDKIGSYDPNKGRLYTWMVNISRNLAIDKLRSKEISKQKKTDSIDASVYSFDKSNYEETSTDYIGMSKVMEKLSADQKQVIDLVYLQGYTHSQVADDFDIPLGTVKTRIKSGMSKLRAILKEN